MKSGTLQTYIFLALIIVSLWLFGLILLPYISTIAISVVLAVLSYPLFQWLKEYVKYGGVASLITMLVVTVIILIPLSVFGALVVREAGELFTLLREGNLSTFSSFIASIETSIQTVIPTFSIDVAALSEQGVSLITNNLSGIFTGTLHTIASVLIGLVLFYYLLKDGDTFRKEVEEKSPLGKTHTSKILDKFRVVIHSVIRGNIVIALIQGILTGVGFAIFGVPNPALWAGVATVMALIPAVGTTLVLLGGIIYIYLNGDPAMALGLIAWSAVIVGLIDDALRPYLIGRGAHIHPMLVLLSVIGGLATFGAAGFIIGPIILSLFVVVFEMYGEIA